MTLQHLQTNSIHMHVTLLAGLAQSKLKPRIAPIQHTLET